MNYLLEVCLLVTLAAGATPAIGAQSPTIAAQTMQKGISVQLPVTSNAVAMPDADQEDALIVSVTDDGSVYFGVDPISPAALAEKVRDGLSNRTERKLYIKAEARTPYANVVKVLDAMRTAGVEAPNLLTAQRDSSGPGTLIPPKAWKC
jgi:biopolymer transport protein ExbD